MIKLGEDANYLASVYPCGKLHLNTVEAHVLGREGGIILIIHRGRQMHHVDIQAEYDSLHHDVCHAYL